MWKKISVVLALAVAAAILGLVRSGPASYRLERATTIAAPPAAIEAQLDTLQRWITWSPWERPDPDLQRIFEGPVSGAGASYSWWGGEQASAGRLTVISSSPEEVHVLFRMDKPRATATDFEFRLAPEGKGTRVTWIATSGSDRVHAALEMLAGRPVANAAELEQGLSHLKSVAEAAAAIETWSVERTARIDARADAVVARIADVHEWTDWSPREILDRKMHEQRGGPAAGAGSTYSWSGNTEVGKGRVTLISVGQNKVEVEVEVEKPAPSLSDYRFTVVPDGNGTLVTWSVSGEKDASGKAFGFFAIPAGEIGSDMERSLARLQTAIEVDAKLAAR
jgi:polyketide cyclase/dehydrase/lipid transport protein